MIKFRLIAKILAGIRGYFWLPCPLCKQHFAGFESARTPLMVTLSEGKSVCANCENKAMEINSLTRDVRIGMAERAGGVR